MSILIIITLIIITLLIKWYNIWDKKVKCWIEQLEEKEEEKIK